MIDDSAHLRDAVHATASIYCSARPIAAARLRAAWHDEDARIMPCVVLTELDRCHQEAGDALAKFRAGDSPLEEGKVINLLNLAFLASMAVVMNVTPEVDR